MYNYPIIPMIYTSDEDDEDLEIDLYANGQVMRIKAIDWTNGFWEIPEEEPEKPEDMKEVEKTFITINGIKVKQLSPTWNISCVHDYVDIGFIHQKMACKHCGKDQ